MADSAPIFFHTTAGTDRPLTPARGWRRRWTCLAAGSIAVAIAAGVVVTIAARLEGTARSVDRSQLTIATVTRGTFTREVAADAQVVAAVSPTLYASATGSVTLKVHAGDAVIKGQPLAAIDSPTLTANLAQEEATLESDRLNWQRARLEAQNKLSQLEALYKQAQLDEITAKRTFDRTRQAYELGAYAELQLLEAQDDLRKARFALEQAKLNYDQQPRQNRFEIGSKRWLQTCAGSSSRSRSNLR